MRTTISRSFTFTVTAVRPRLVVGSITRGCVGGAGRRTSVSLTWSRIPEISYQERSGPASGSTSSRISRTPQAIILTNGLEVGASQTLINSFSTANLSVGTHTLYVMADYWGNQVGESNEANNVRYGDLRRCRHRRRADLPGRGLTSPPPRRSFRAMPWTSS